MSEHHGGLTVGAELARPIPLGLLEALPGRLEETDAQLLAVNERPAERRSNQWK